MWSLVCLKIRRRLVACSLLALLGGSCGDGEGGVPIGGCPPGTAFRSVCTSCGVVGGCGEWMNTCAKICDDQVDCDPTPSVQGSFCVEGVCQVGGCL
jgi:hypothetical protein